MKSKNLTLLLVLVLVGMFSFGQELVPKKPMFEVFTSSTCGPCAAQNPYLDAVLNDNPGEYALIKYQMDWPGNGDLYYLPDGGIRKSYYGITGVPSFWINGENYSSIVDFNQAEFDSYTDELTNLAISLSASINESFEVSITANISAVEAIDAGLRTHVVVVEKLTTENVGSNGELEFSSVLMAMNPDGNGTELAAFAEGEDQVIGAIIDMSETNMEQANDLAVVVFVQDHTTKNIIQSEMVDVTHSISEYTISFNVTDSEGNHVEEAEIFLQSYGTHFSNEMGDISYEGILPGTYNYEVSKAGLYPTSGTIEVVDENISESIVLEVPDYFFYEDFETEIPDTWTLHVTSPDYLYHYDGKAIFFKQSSGTNPIMLVTPEIDLSNVETLQFKTGEGYGLGSLQVGTVSDPANPATFAELANYTPGADWEEHSLNIQEQEIVNNYLAFNFTSDYMEFFSFDDFILTEKNSESTYTVTFNIVDSDNNPIENANVTFDGTLLATNADGNVLFTGVSEGNYDYMIEDDNATSITENIEVISDTTVTKTLTYVGMHEFVESIISVYPNPAKDYLMFEINDNYSFRIFQLNGKLMQEGVVTKSANTIKTSNLHTGIYFIELKNSLHTKTIKFSIAN